MTKNGDALLRQRDVFDVRERVDAALLHRGEQEETVAIRREHRMILDL